MDNVMVQMTRTLLAASFLLLCAGPAIGAPQCRPGEIPDSRCSPGVVASTNVADVCGEVNGKSYSERHRKTPEGLKQAIRKRYVVEQNRGDAEIDHRVPLALGGERPKRTPKTSQPKSSGAKSD